MPDSAAQIFQIRHGSIPRYQVVDPVIDGLQKPPRGYITIEADMEIGRWIESQPLYMWKHGDIPAYVPIRDRFIISEKLYTLLVLRWS